MLVEKNSEIFPYPIGIPRWKITKVRHKCVVTNLNDHMKTQLFEGLISNSEKLVIN